MRAKIQPTVIMSILFLAVFLNLSPFAQTGEVGAEPAPPPPMPSLPDILSGERQVLPVDDILVAQTFQSQTEVFAERYVNLGLTSNMVVSQVNGRKLISNRLTAVGQSGPELIAAGRLFRSSTDVGVTFTFTDRDDWGIPQPTHLQSTLLTGTGIGEAVVESVPIQPLAPDGYTRLGPRAIAVADFNGDGLGDVVFHAGSTELTGSETIIGTASVTSAPSSLQFGPKYVGGPACLDMKAADLNADGKPELICLYHSADLLYVTVHTVDPGTLTILDPPGNTAQIALWQSGDKARLAVGKFDDDMGDNEIAVVLGGAVVPGGNYCANDTYCPLYVIPIKVLIVAPPPTGTGEVSFARVPAVDIGPFMNGSTGSNWKRLVGLEVATGKLDWFGGNPRDQLVVAAGMNSDSHYKGYAAVVVNFTTDGTNPMSISTDQVKASAYNNATASTTCLLDVAVGRFGPPPALDENTAPTNSQVALLLGGLASGYSQQANCDKDAWNTVAYKSMSVGTYLIDPGNSYKIAQTSNTALPTGGAETGGITIAPPRMAVGDFQGRSLLLGQPIIMTVATQVQPQFVIGAPPMHLDYFTPPLTTERTDCYDSLAKVHGSEPTSGSGASGAQGCIQNVSAYPGLSTGGATATCDYCAKFSTSTDATHAGWQESTTSHTWSNEGGGSTSYKFGSVEPNIIQRGGLQFELHGSAKVMHTNTQSTRDDVLKEEKVDLSTWTNTEDEVLYTVQDVYLYFYPVIGRTDDNGNPLYLHFSVPDKTQMKNAPASELLWFQPPHQVGNIFSYPGNEAQLLADYPGAADRSGPVWWSSTSPTNAQINWIENDATTKTAGEVDKTEWNVGTSVTAAAYLGGGFSTKDTLKYDHNESTANQYTNTAKATLAKSEGFTVASVGLTKVANSAYGAEARILGSAAPTLASGYWDQPVPMPDPQGTPGDGFPPDLTLDGPMQLVYTADMLSNSNDFHAGTLWTSVYGAAPDIALQHYKQFFWVKRDSTVSQSDVWMFVPLYDNIDLSTVYQADFLKMKGFFITPATASPSQGPQGPQMTMATAGDKLRLAARVYNYSLAPPAGATVNVKVRFYAHQLAADDAYHQVWGDDGCILIGEDSVPIGGFRSDAMATTASNRAMAYTTFDTTGRGGQYFMFWVVAWAEKADGTLVPELPQHGLSSKPPDGCPANSILGMPTEFYSNNVGFYEQPFYIMKSLAAAPSPTAKLLHPFSLGALTVSPVRADRPYAGELWELEVPLQAGDQGALGVHLEHAGQGPGGRVSNTRIIPFIEAGQTYADRLTFRPLWCGPHSALVTARPAFRDPVSATIALEIPCRPEDVTAFFNDVLTNASLAGLVSVNKNGHVEGRLAALQNAILTAEQLAHKGAKKGACMQYWEALQRVADAGDGPVAQLLQDIITNAAGQLRCW